METLMSEKLEEAGSQTSEKEQTDEIVLEKDLEQQLDTANYPETDLSKGIVGWEGQDDPNHPQNFSPTRKWVLLSFLSFNTFISPLASTMFSPTVSYVATDLGVTDETLLSLSISIFLMGYAFGPLLLAPLSEMYGRRVILNYANWFFVIWQVACALARNITSLIIFRLLAGIGGSGCLTLGAGVIADVFPIRQRGLATSLWSLGPLIGPIVGPVAGGFMGEKIGWRWVFWVLTMVCGVLATTLQFLNQETYAPVLIHRKTMRLSKELARNDLRSAYATSEEVSLATTLRVGLRRPFVLFLKSPIVMALSTYMAFVYGLLYLFFTTISTVFQSQYGFSTGISGLAYMGIGCGALLGLTAMAFTSDRLIVKLTVRNGGKYEPEMRLPMMVFYACFLPISFFWYGWTADRNVFWLVPIIGMVPFSFGMMGLYLPIQTYIIDSYPAYAASANATLVVVRSLVGALLPLAGPSMFETLGLGWGNSLLGFIALGCVPIPIIFSRYGQRIRERFPVDMK